MKILIADKLDQVGLDRIKALNLPYTFEPNISPEHLAEHTQDVSILVVRGKKVSGKVLHASPTLKLVVRAGAGFNTIDVDAANACGIFVANCPGKNAIAVAELTIGLLLSLDRRIPQAHAAMQNGQWNKREFSRSGGLFGKTLGVIGVGNIGTASAPPSDAGFYYSRDDRCSMISDTELGTRVASSASTAAAKCLG